MKLFRKIFAVSKCFSIIFLFIFFSIESTFTLNCQKNEILSILFSTENNFQMCNASFISDKPDIGINGICSYTTCRTNKTFDAFKDISKSLLHKINGLRDVEKDFIKLDGKLKLLVIELVDCLAYKVYLSINYTDFIKCPSRIMLDFYKAFTIQIRLSSNGHLSDFLKFSKCTIHNLDTKTKSFIDKFGRISKKLVPFVYQETKSLESHSEQRMLVEGSGVKLDDEDYSIKDSFFQLYYPSGAIVKHKNIKKYPKSNKTLVLNETSRSKNSKLKNGFSNDLLMIIIILFTVICCLAV